jgi:hypothetical protein
VQRADRGQAHPADQKGKDQSDDTVQTRIRETYTWLLVPTQELKGDASWQEVKVPVAPESLPLRASRKLRDEELLLTNMAGVRLRLEIERVPLWENDHVGVKRLRELFAQYLYLPRLRDEDTLLEAIQDGIAKTTWNPDTFAYADAWDEGQGRFTGLVAGSYGGVMLNSSSAVVRPEAAARQVAEEGTVTVSEAVTESVPSGVTTTPASGEGPPADVVHRFHGSVSIDPVRAGRDVSEIADAVIQYLAALPNAGVAVTLEIEADLPDGVPENVIRTVTENARTLKFKIHGFEKD